MTSLNRFNLELVPEVIIKVGEPSQLSTSPEVRLCVEALLF